MPSPSQPPDLRADVCGLLAHKMLQEGRNGRVAAVFEKTFYIRSGDGAACIGSTALISSPITVATDTCPTTDWRAGAMQVDIPWRISNSTIVFGHRLRISLKGAHIWRPGQPVRRRCDQALIQAMALFCHAVKSRAPNKGLGMLVVQPSPPNDQRLLKVAREPVEQLRRWLATTGCGDSAASSTMLQSARPLLGLGPGLTPSGDDFLAGIMIALHAFGREDSAHELWQTIHPWALQAGNFISFAHLAAASKGLGFAPIHDFLHVLLQGDSAKLTMHLDSIDNIGHTSGWDTLAGVFTAVDVLKEKDGSLKFKEFHRAPIIREPCQ